VTKSQFDTLITTARAADVALPAADQDFQHAEADLHVKHNTLADFVTAALQQGRSQFAPGSAEREVIDAIPSFPATQPPDQAVIDEAVLIDSGTARIRYHADGATSYDVLYLAPGATDYITLTEDNIAKEYLVTVTPGDNKIKVVGRNSRGPGPESEVTTVPAT
jgi:hypothetical protein